MRHFEFELDGDELIIETDAPSRTHAATFEPLIVTGFAGRAILDDDGVIVEVHRNCGPELWSGMHPRNAVTRAIVVWLYTHHGAEFAPVERPPARRISEYI